MHFDFNVIFQILRCRLETSEERAAIRVRTMDENDLHVVEVLQQFYPDIRLMGIRRYSAQK